MERKNHIALGKEGEKLAVQLARDRGLSILAINYTFKKGEIDIIAKDNDELVFIEVKTRNSSYFGEPYLAVNRSKQRQIIKVANHFIQEKGIDQEIRFDVVSIILNGTSRKVDYIENAFTPTV